MALQSPEKHWWQPLGKQEKIWVTVSVVFLVTLFFSLPLWHMFAEQNTPHESYRVLPNDFRKITQNFIDRYRVDTVNGIPVVRPPAGDVYLMSMQFQWSPILELKKGETYRVHVSSLDVNHGFSLQPVNMNFQILPGYVYVLTLTPPKAGSYTIICNEFCGIGHHLMSGQIIVKE
jgi:cytochrome c oxidase subunit 2